MKLRIARKMDQRPLHQYPNKRRDDRVWYRVYSGEQLLRAERRLRKSWRRRSPMDAGGGRVVSGDFFAANRVQSRRGRQLALKRIGVS